MERKRKRKNEGFTGKVELVGRIKMKPPPCGQKRLGHERHSVWRLKNLVTLALLMNTLQRRRSRRRRRSVVRLPKRHFTEAPDFLFRERLLTVNSHPSTGIRHTVTAGDSVSPEIIFFEFDSLRRSFFEVVCMAFLSVYACTVNNVLSLSKRRRFEAGWVL